MLLTNRLNLPQAIVNALSVDEYSRGAANISVTGLSSPPRQQALQNVHGAELEEDASKLIFALLGKAVHTILESGGATVLSVLDLVRRSMGGEVKATEELRALLARLDADGTVKEKRFFMRVPGPLSEWTISGAMDSIDLEALGDGSVSIDDWKTAKVAEMVYGVKVEREQQLNVYKVLLEAQGFKVGRLRDIFILRDWSEIQASRQPAEVATLTGTQPPSSYPEAQIVVHEVRIWSPQEAVEFIVKRVALHQQAQRAYQLYGGQEALPLCTDDERWARGRKYAAIKEGLTRGKTYDTREEAEAYANEHTTGFDYIINPDAGTRVSVKKADGTGRAKFFDTTAEAEEWVKSKWDIYQVVERPAESIRCEFYCSVSFICEQWRAIREERANGVS